MRLEGLNKAPFRAGDRVCCAISGGADSVALLLALREANTAKESLGVVLSAVHVHHGLRGAEADADEVFVCELCARLDIPLTARRVDTAARQASEREGLEEAARELRYGVFRQLLSENKADTIATAHTLDDQAETVVMKCLRGAWTEGLGGISPVVEVRPSAGTPVAGPQGLGARSPYRLGAGAEAPAPASGAYGRIVRSLLGVRRAEIEAFLRERGQPWREDSTNRDLKLTRNRVRHELMPLLRSFNPEIDRLLARTAAIARDEEAYWAAEMARLLPGLLLPGRPVRGGGRAVSTDVGAGAVAIELERLRGLHPASRRRVVRAAARTLGYRLSSEETARLLELAGLESETEAGPAAARRIGRRLELAGGLQAERSARELRLSGVRV